MRLPSVSSQKAVKLSFQAGGGAQGSSSPLGTVPPWSAMPLGDEQEKSARTGL